MSPAKPRELRPVRAECRRRVEVISAIEGRFATGSDVDGDQCMNYVNDVVVGSLLSYCDQSISCCIDTNICKNAARIGCNFCRRAVSSLLIDLIIAEVDEIDDVVFHGIGAAAVTVNLRPRVERGRCDVSDRAVGGSDDDDVTTLFERSCLDPVNVVAVDAWLQQR